MSRLRRLFTNLACRTGLRTGKSVETSGGLPLTRQGTFGGFPLSDYGVSGAVGTAPDRSPLHPVPPTFVGEATFPGNARGLSLLFSTAGQGGTVDSVAARFPGVEPLRAASGVSDEISFGRGKMIRRIGVCRDPVPLSGKESTFGSNYPAVSLLVGDGTTISDHPHLPSSHWNEIGGPDLSSGAECGMAVVGGVLYANLPRSLYRRYATGCVGETVVSETARTPSVPAGEYRCDFFDGTSRVFTLPAALHGTEGCRDLLVVSRCGAKLIKKTCVYSFDGTEEPTVLRNYQSTGESLFRFAKSDFGAASSGTPPTCAYFVYADTTPFGMIGEYADVPAFCEDETYWYFYIPDKSLIAGFRSYMSERVQAGAPVELVYEAAEIEETTLSSYRAATAEVGLVPSLDSVSGGIADDEAFDAADDLTLVPAFGEFLEEERQAGRTPEIFYVLPEIDVTETELTLPVLHAGEGATVFTAAATQAGGLDPATGRFVAYSEE